MPKEPSARVVKEGGGGVCEGAMCKGLGLFVGRMWDAEGGRGRRDARIRLGCRQGGGRNVPEEREVEAERGRRGNRCVGVPLPHLESAYPIQPEDVGLVEPFIYPAGLATRVRVELELGLALGGGWTRISGHGPCLTW
jgi:hypothetical protein